MQPPIAPPWWSPSGPQPPLWKPPSQCVETCSATTHGVSVLSPAPPVPTGTPTHKRHRSVQLISNPSHVHPPHAIPLVPEAHHSSLSHTVTFDSRGRDYGDQINYDLIPKRRCRHYSKSRSAKALMTIDCPNIACVLAATRAAAPTVPAAVSGDRKWIVLHLFIDIAFHLR